MIGPVGLFTSFVWVCSIIWGIIINILLDQGFYIIMFSLGPLIVLSFTRGYMYFTMNDFDYFQDVVKLNKKIDKHNKELDEVDAKKAEIQK